MKYLTKISAVLFFSLVCEACGSDYLDTVPGDSTSPSTLFQDEESAAYAISGLEKLMKKQYTGYYGQGFNGEGTVKLYYGEYPGGDMFVPRSAYYTLFNQALHASVDSKWLNYPWYYYYKVISNANMILEYVKPEASRQYKYIYAQALTYRAYCYLNLVQLYAPRWCDSEDGKADGVVLRIDASNDSRPLASLSECYRQIYEDLGTAIRYYSESGIEREPGKNHKVNIEAAYAVYARAALTREDWQNAATYAALARKGYPLMDTETYLSGFNRVNSEWIWSICDEEDEQIYYYSLGANMAYNTSAPVVCSYPCCINRELYDRLSEKDIRREMFLDPEGYAYTTSTGRAGAALTAYARSLYPELDKSALVYAYMQFKFKCTAQPGVMSFNLFRSSEMYLIEAEANCHLTGKEEAARRLLTELVGGSGRNPGYTCSQSGQALLDEIAFYRSIELWGEGFSWFDYKRRKDKIERHTYEGGGNYLANSAVTILPDEVNQWIWMIPSRESDYNEDLK